MSARHLTRLLPKVAGRVNGRAMSQISPRPLRPDMTASRKAGGGAIARAVSPMMEDTQGLSADDDFGHQNARVDGEHISGHESTADNPCPQDERGPPTGAQQSAPSLQNPEDTIDDQAGIVSYSKGIESLLFKQLERPRLAERSAADLSLEEAERVSSQARKFYHHNFSLHPGGEWFYEEVEASYIQQALGDDPNDLDTHFLRTINQFRCVLNDNICRMLLWITPILVALSLVGAIAFHRFSAPLPVPGFVSALLPAFVDASAFSAFSITLIIFCALLFLCFSWPFKVVQQRNMLNLDNYITSKFGRINHNFQVAKRRALNVERDKRMGEREALKYEAGVWTLSYHWFAMRLLLCEMMIRNQFYQVRRNTSLYWLGGIALSAAVVAGGAVMAAISAPPGSVLAGVLVSGGLMILFAAILLRRTTAEMFQVVEDSEWGRFHLVHLNATIADHVGEDKVQIVTFRDRNRME